MKIKRDNQGVISVQMKPYGRYYILFHRINKGEYEQYIRLKNKEYTFNLDELNEIQKYIQNLEVKNDRGTKKSN